MPISFADALRKAQNASKIGHSKSINKLNSNITFDNPQDDKSRRQKKSRYQKQVASQRTRKPVDKNHKNFHPPEISSTTRSNAFRNHKPSSDVCFGDILKLPSQLQSKEIRSILVKPQIAPDLCHDFPSLGDASENVSATPRKLKKTPGKDTLPRNVKTAKPLLNRVVKNVSKKELVNAKKTPTNMALKSKKIPVNGSSSPRKNNLQKPSSILDALSAKQRSLEEETQMGTFIKNPAAVQKGRQRLGPRKKRFSTLKKKVLQERLEQWNFQSLFRNQMVSDEHALTVALWNFCLPEEAEDEDEFQELIKNLREMSAKVGNLEDLYIKKDCGHAFCLFESTETAQAAEACWNGLVLGGTKLETKLLSGCHKGEKWKEWVNNVYRENDEEKELSGTNVVILDNILTQDDINDEDCLEECLNDIRVIASSLGQLEDLSVENATQVLLTYRGGHRAIRHFDGIVLGGQVVRARLKENSGGCLIVIFNVLTGEDFADEECLNESLNDLRELASRYGIVRDLQVHARESGSILVHYDEDVEDQAIYGFNNLVIGGNSIFARKYEKEGPCNEKICLKNFLTEEDLEDDDCLEETEADIAELAKRFGKVTCIDVDVEGRQINISYNDSSLNVKKAVDGFNRMIIGGRKVVAVLESEENEESGSTFNVQTLNPANETIGSSAIKPMYSGDKLVPERFAECKRVPKIPSTGARKYAALIKDETVKPLLQEMLGELMRLQKRAAEDKNAKARRRLVMGLREVARGIRAHKVRLVVMANNLDEYGIIDEKLQEIIDLAREESVPIFYEFNKRRLGKAVGKSIKIGVIGVQNADGANQQFKKLISLANKHGAY